MDGTGDLELMFYTKEIELLAGCSCVELWNLKVDIHCITGFIQIIDYSIEKSTVLIQTYISALNCRMIHLHSLRKWK